LEVDLRENVPFLFDRDTDTDTETETEREKEREGQKERGERGVPLPFLSLFSNFYDEWPTRK